MTFEIGLVLGVLGVTILLFALEVFRVDVTAILVMLTLAWLRLVTPQEAFSGLASNAVVAIIAVMILGYGMTRSGVINRVVGPIMRVGGANEKRLTALVSFVVGIISAVMQNIGAAALFLPAMMRISRNTRIPASRLLMPIGFAAILGGTLSMVGSGPLIILNDLLRQVGEPAYGLFSVTPLGLVLLLAGIAYFLVLGRWVLPSATGEPEPTSPQQELIETWHLPSTIHQCVVSPGSPLIGKTREESGLWCDYHLNLLAIAEGDEILYAPWRQTRFLAGQELALLGNAEEMERLTVDFGVSPIQNPRTFEMLSSRETAGFAEVVIPPRSRIAGKTLRQIALRKHYTVEPILLLSGTHKERDDFSDQPLQAGDALVVHGLVDSIQALDDHGDFVLVTPMQSEATDRSKSLIASICLVGALLLAFTGTPLSLALMSGALAMILLRVVPIDEAYRAVDWRTVFLLAGLIPLGVAMEKSGAASYVANQMMGLLQGSHVLVILGAIATLATLFSLFMSNVAATVLLVPLVMIIGETIGANPRALALLVGVCASNSFLLPTHQVNALFMTPGGYRNADYLRAGGVMTLLFIVIASIVVYLFYL